MTTTRKSHRPNRWVRMGALVLLMGAAQAMLVRTSSGQEVRGSSDVAADTSAASATVEPMVPLELLQGGSTCEGCEPSKSEVELTFSKPVDADELCKQLKVSPAVNLSPIDDGERRRVRLRGNLAPATRYEIVVPAGFCAQKGSCLETEAKFSLRTGGGYPTVRMPVQNTVLPPGGKIPMRFQHVAEATVTLVALRDNEIGAALSLVGGYHWDESPIAKLPKATQARAKKIVIDTDQLERPGEFELDPFTQVSGDQIFVVLEAKGTAAKAAVYQRAGVGVLTKVGADDGLVWVTDTRTGKPLRGAQVSLFHGNSSTWRAATDSNGLVRLPARKRLERSGTHGMPFAVVQAQGHKYVTGTNWTDGLDPWMFDLPYYYYSGQEALRGMVTVERGIYRPGEKVHVLGVLRQRLPSGKLAPPIGVATIAVSDPDGAEVVRQNVHLTAYGTLRHSFDLPPHGGVGQYYLRLEKDGVTFHHSFEVGEFRAATFEIQMPKAGPAEIEAGEVVVPIEGRYLYGAPVARGQARYHVSMRQRRSYYEGYSSYSFANTSSYYYYNDYPQQLTTGDLELDDHGRAELRIPLSSLPKPEAGHSPVADLIVEATVTDAANDAITARTVQSVARSDVHVGVASDSWVVSPRQGWDVRVIALDAAGNPKKGETLEVALERTWYDSVAEEGPHGVRYRSSREQQVVATKTVTSDSRPLALHFDLPGGGDYVVRVHRVGEPYVSSRQVWAYGSEANAPALNNPRIELKLDRDSYEPGDTATAYAAVPYPKSTALLTVERSGVMLAKVVELGGAEAALQLEVAEAHLPNAYVGLAVVPRSTNATAPATGYPFRAGYTELKVSTEQRRLRVYVEPQQEKAEPGAGANVKVKVRDYRDQPVRAEVTLWAADEGVLMLTGYRTPDPFAPAYASYELDVTSATNLSRWTHYDPDAWLDGGGDSSPGGGSALRSRFLHTAHFSKGVVTNAKGEATVKFDLPDNVTRWRVMAVAADIGQRFGKGESAIATSKPLQVLPSLPRFVTEGDLVDVGLVVHNQLGADSLTKVTLDVAGAKVLGNGARDVEVASGKQQQVRFPVLVEQPGRMVVRARVSGAGKSDGFEISLPAHRSTRSASEVLSEGALAGTAASYLSVPDNARAGSTELEIVLSPTILASLGPGVEALLDYPHGCAEQKTSRLIPMAALGDLVRSLELRGFSQDQHRERLQQTIAELEKHQNGDGGFGLWVESDSDPWVTAFVLFGWTVAREHDYRISESRFGNAIRYLEQAVRDDALHDGYFGYDSGALTSYGLGRNRRPDQGLGARLYEHRDDLSVFDRGLLAAALASGDADQREQSLRLLSDLEGKRTMKGSAAVIPGGSESAYYGFGRDARATAMIVHALVAAGRATDAEPYVRGLLAQRGKDGTWGTTYNNLWALMALGGYAKEERAAIRPATVTVMLDGKQVAQASVSGTALTERIVFSSDQLPPPGGAAKFALQASPGARLEHVVRLRYTPTPGSQGAVRHGYSIDRKVYDADTDKPVSSPRVGQLLRVELTVKNDSERNQVALSDHLPAGLEAVNARLATAQQAVQNRRDWTWRGVEVHDERVSFFAYGLDSGVHQVTYLARASRSGEFVWPAASVESMYNPDEYARSDIGQMIVAR